MAPLLDRVPPTLETDAGRLAERLDGLITLRLGLRGALLAKIEYYVPWRQHVLKPFPGTVWSDGCLADVLDFIGKIKRGEA